MTIEKQLYTGGLFLALKAKIETFRGFAKHVRSSRYKRQLNELAHNLELKFDEIANDTKALGKNLHRPLERLNQGFNALTVFVEYIKETNLKNLEKYGFKSTVNRKIAREEIELEINLHALQQPCNPNSTSSGKEAALLNALYQLGNGIKNNINTALMNQFEMSELRHVYGQNELKDILSAAKGLMKIKRNLPEYKFDAERIKHLMGVMRKALKKSEELLKIQLLALNPDMVEITKLDFDSYEHTNLAKERIYGPSSGLPVYREPNPLKGLNIRLMEKNPEFRRIRAIGNYLTQELNLLINQRYQNLSAIERLLDKKESYINSLEQNPISTALRAGDEYINNSIFRNSGYTNHHGALHTLTTASISGDIYKAFRNESFEHTQSPESPQAKGDSNDEKIQKIFTKCLDLLMSFEYTQNTGAIIPFKTKHHLRKKPYFQ